MHASEAGTGPLHNPVDFLPTYWTIDGLSFPNTIHASIDQPAFSWTNWIAAHPGYDPFITGSASAKTKVLVRLINIGSQEQPMHVHGFHPKVIGKDQRPWSWANPPGMPTGKGLEMNTITISSGETYELLFDFGSQAASGNYAAGVMSRYNVADGSPQLNTATAFPVIPDPFNAAYAYAGAAVPNLFPWHSHDDYKATNNGTYPGGMFTMLQVNP